MATVTRWPLPPEFSNYLQFLTPERRGKIYYTKYIVNKIGELDIGRNMVREWQVPANFLDNNGWGNPTGITYGPDRLIDRRSTPEHRAGMDRAESETVPRLRSTAETEKGDSTDPEERRGKPAMEMINMFLHRPGWFRI